MNNYIFRSPIGLLEIKEENEKIIGLDLLQNTFSMDIAKYAYHSDLIYEAYIQINEYFKGKRRKFNLPICCIGTAFQKLVWKELRNITITIDYNNVICFLQRTEIVFMNNIFAERLKKAMEQKNMKQIDLVKKAAEQGVKLGKSHVSLLEEAKRASILVSISQIRNS